MQTTSTTSTRPTARELRTMNAHRGHRAPMDRSGLTAIGVTVLLALVSGVALVADLVVGRGLGWVFGVGFVLGCLWVAARVRRSQDLAALIAPPLVFAAAVLLANMLIGGQSSGHFPVRQALDLATSLAVGAPMLLTGFGVAAVVVIVRRWRGRRP